VPSLLHYVELGFRWVRYAALSQPSTDGIVTEADVELRVILPILTAASFLEIPSAWIKGKQYLAPTQLDEAAGRARG
jgi:hypothetical protein